MEHNLDVLHSTAERDSFYHRIWVGSGAPYSQPLVLGGEARAQAKRSHHSNSLLQLGMSAPSHALLNTAQTFLLVILNTLQVVNYSFV
jgi:hypothetical protein